MGLRQITSLFLTLILLCSFALAQTQPTESDADKAKKKKEQDERIVQLLDQAIGEAVSLRLPQNRAVVYAMSADLYWQFDEKRARELFRNAAAEIVSLNQEPEKERSGSSPQDLLAGRFSFSPDVRKEILPLVANHDAEFALELLVQTRSAKLVEAIERIATQNKLPTSDILSTLNSDNLKAAQELALEQRLALLAADASPDTAIKLIKDSISKGISRSVLPLLQKLHKKDAKKATELAGDVIKKLVETDMSKGYDDLQIGVYFLQFGIKPAVGSGKEKDFTFSDAQLKDLATKVANTLLNAPGSLLMSGFCGPQCRRSKNLLLIK